MWPPQKWADKKGWYLTRDTPGRNYFNLHIKQANGKWMMMAGGPMSHMTKNLRKFGLIK